MKQQNDIQASDQGQRSKNDKAWRDYISKSNFSLDGRSHEISARKLKEVTNREPRLLAKVDEPKHLPTILRKAGYSILAITNGSYLIFKGNIFNEVEKCSEKALYQPRIEFPLRTFGRGTGESEYLDNALNTGLISEFMNCGKLYLTIRGRERTTSFDFWVGEKETKVHVSGVQIEVDAGYEGENEIILVEGKIGDRDHFNIRQLYYPYRHFSQLVNDKTVRNLFFTYDLSKATYSMREYVFSDPERINSIYQKKCCIYSLITPQTYKADDLFDENYITDNNIIPQANDLNKIFELLTLINSGQNTVPDIAEHFMFDERQSNYYGEAAESLGLISRSKGGFELTKRGLELISLEPQKQQSFILKTMMNSWYFRKLIRVAKKNGFYTKSDIQEMILSVKKHNGKKRYTNSTIGRRVSTLYSWSKWMSEEFELFKIDNDKVVLS